MEFDDGTVHGAELDVRAVVLGHPGSESTGRHRTFVNVCRGGEGRKVGGG